MTYDEYEAVLEVARNEYSEALALDNELDTPETYARLQETYVRLTQMRREWAGRKAPPVVSFRTNTCEQYDKPAGTSPKIRRFMS